MEKVKVGVIGCGMISEVYMKNITERFCDALELTACADLYPAAAEKRAEQFGIRALSVEELLSDPDVEIVLNLTIPAAHYEISKKAILAGKHAYSEKPLALTYEQGKELLELAKEKGVLVASAPDTFLGAGLQTCIDLLDSGVIGKPVAAQAFMIGSGPERFHPNPGFFYQEGAGPLFDMGPYYYTALASAFGPAKRVVGLGSRAYTERAVQVPESKFYPGNFPVNVDTYVVGMVEFENGVIANVTTSWDFRFWPFESPLPLLTIFGTEGTLYMPDPNTFDGTREDLSSSELSYVVYVQHGAEPKEAIPLKYEYPENSRGLGVADFARCIRQGGTPRVSGEMSFHVLEMMLGISESAKTGTYYEMTSTFTKPKLLSKG